MVGKMALSAGTYRGTRLSPSSRQVFLYSRVPSEILKETATKIGKLLSNETRGRNGNVKEKSLLQLESEDDKAKAESEKMKGGIDRSNPRRSKRRKTFIIFLKKGIHLILINFKKT